MRDILKTVSVVLYIIPFAFIYTVLAVSCMLLGGICIVCEKIWHKEHLFDSMCGGVSKL